MARSDTAERQAAALSAALDELEDRLDALPLGADPDSVAQALAEPIRALDAAAKEVST